MKTSRQYDAFVDKFKPRHTSDDTHTPPNVYAVAHDMSPHLQYLRGAIHDPLNPPRGTQRVYKTAATDGPMLARAWADSGKVTGWYVETKKPTGEGGGRKRT